MNSVTFLRILWLVVAIWFELGVFYLDVLKCEWPDSALLPVPSGTPLGRERLASTPTITATHVLLIADPQIPHRRSYNRAPWLTYLIRVVVDLNLRKNWRAALRKKPDVVIFLGDMMDGGRLNMEEDEYEQYYQRFQHIFRLPSRIPVYFIPGNHDTGLRSSSFFSPEADVRYRNHFGNPNRHITIANHSLVLLDAPSLVEEDDQRIGQGKSFELWTPMVGGPVEFVKRIALAKDKDPVVLFSHIPLDRETTDCGPLREKGTIRPGRGLGYQNLLGRELSTFLLSTLRPSVVFGGDDHDYCEHLHQTETTEGITWTTREITVKSFSMAMGIQRPGFQLLSLAPRLETPFERLQRTHADACCLLPNQIWIYRSVYVRLLLASVIIIILSNVRRRHRHNRRETEDAFKKAYLPLPVSITPMIGMLTWPKQRWDFLRRCHIFNPFRASSRRDVGSSFLRGCIRDVFAVGVIPLTVFVLVSGYFFL